MKCTRIATMTTPLNAILAGLMLSGCALAQTPAAPWGLMCELIAQPELSPIGDSKPEFSWIVGSMGRQTAYQILVASDRTNLDKNQGDLWDSGRVVSSRSTALEYAGRPLPSEAVCFWKVRTWQDSVEAGPFSTVQSFRTGKLDGPYETTRYALLEAKIQPARMVQKAEGHYFVDFAKAAFGAVELTLTSPEAGRKVEVHLGEVPAGDAIDRNPGGSRRHRMMTLSLDQGTRTYRVAVTPDKRNTGPLAIKMPASVGEVMPFRYCEIVNSPSEIDSSSIRQIAVHYPFEDDASRFVCSDPVLNDVWELCKYSIKATSFCGVYVDGDRERIPYEGDAYINQLCHYSVDREYTMARYSHEYLITHATWPTEWILHSVLMAWADYLYTGDTDSLSHFYDDLKAKTLLALAREDGLISTQTGLVTKDVLASIHLNGNLRDLVDWPHGNILGLQGGYGETDDFEFKPINTVVNTFHYRALVLMSRMADAIEKQDDAARFAQAAEKVRRSFNDKLFDKTKGVYVDGEGSTHSALHANMFPLAFGLVPPERVRSVAEFIKSRGMVCSVYGSQYLLEALYEAGEGDFALKLMTDRSSDRSWPHMIYNVGTTITLEAWDNKYKPNQDWNHAWGAAPANIIPRCLMGVQPIAPGFAKVRIQPQLGGLKAGSLDLPTVRGAIHVDFASEPGESFTLNVELPGNTEAVVCLPLWPGDRPLAYHNGKAIAARQEGNFLVVPDVPAGRHRFELRP